MLNQNMTSLTQQNSQGFKKIQKLPKCSQEKETSIKFQTSIVPLQLELEMHYKRSDTEAPYPIKTHALMHTHTHTIPEYKVPKARIFLCLLKMLHKNY
jgi:hypothetical protein